MGRVGTKVTITGTNLAGATSVTLKNVPATSFAVLSPTKISVVVPRVSNGRAYWKITSPGGTATSPSPFLYLG